jgi:putative transcriptional regulator
MNTNHLKEILRRKAELENGTVAPGRVTEITFDADGKPVRRQLAPNVYQQERKSAAHAARISEARAKLRLTQSEFAALLGTSRRTVESWEQGRRSPTGAARILIAVAVKHPKAVLAEVV